MRLSHPAAIKFVGLVAGWLIRGWIGTLDVRFAVDDFGALPHRIGRPRIYISWHEMILLPAHTHARVGTALVSKHRDGELIAQILRMLRGRSIRGSTNRGGVQALRQMIRHGRTQHIVLAVDGPRGPRRVVPAGAVYLASRTGMPIVPTGFAFSNCWRVGSWDRLALPRPFSRATGLFGRPIDIPDGLARADIDSFRRTVQDAMDAVQARAEALVTHPAAVRLLTLEQVHTL